MENLFTYIQAIKEDTSKVSILDRVESTASFEQDGIITDTYELTVRFDNGVLLRKTTEQDQLDDSDSICAECWISYELIESPENLNIRPRKKTFINTCQEAFWLKINQVRS
ncbi:MAG: hypothetical protein ACK5NC_14485 [Vibrio sp.]